MGLKVLMIGAYPLEPDAVHGGIESVTSTLVPALAAHDDIDSVTVLRFHQGEASTDERYLGDKVRICYVSGQARFRTITGSFLDVRKARRLMTSVRPDVVHGQDIGTNGDIAVKCSQHSVVTVHGLPHVEIRLSAQQTFRNRLRIKPIDAMVRRVLRRAKVVISISKYDADQLGNLANATRVSIANPTAAEFFALAPSGVTEQRLLFAGVVSERKNLEGLLKAFAIAYKAVPGARLVMVGPQPDSDYAATVRGLVASLGLTQCVDIAGLVDNHRLGQEIAAARAVVLFSREETAPTIIAQAMAAGKPVIASAVGGVSEMVVDGETGLLVDSGDETALADRMRVLLDDQDLCLRMGALGHERALHRYSPEVIAQRTVDAYRTALH